MNPIFLAAIQKGKVIFKDKDLFDKFIYTLEGKGVEVIVRKKKKRRSNSQNAYYWGVVIVYLCDETGYNDEEMHDALKMKFLPDNTRKIPTLRSTTTLSTMDFEEYLEKIRIWAASELNCVIPMPSEVDFDSRPLESPPVDEKTLDEIFAWAGKSFMTKEKIMQICKSSFHGREPRNLKQDEAERLDTLILAQLNEE